MGRRKNCFFDHAGQKHNPAGTGILVALEPKSTSSTSPRASGKHGIGIKNKEALEMEGAMSDRVQRNVQKWQPPDCSDTVYSDEGGFEEEEC